MRRSWLDRVLGRADAADVRQELVKLAAAGDWSGVKQLTDQVMAALPTDVAVLQHAARARLELAAEDDCEAATGEARGWLDTAFAQEPGAADTLYLRGWCDWLAHDAAAAAQTWQQAWNLEPGRRDVRDGLVLAWNALGTVPEWGVPVVEIALADSTG